MTETCQKCNGVGREEDTNTVNPTHTECSECHGNGFVGEREIEEVEEINDEEVVEKPKKRGLFK